MFGYVKVYKSELKIKHYEAYKGIYCSVCAALGRDYGLFARMTLSYDATALALIRLSAANCSLCFQNKRCPFNPSKRCHFCQNNAEAFSFAAAVSVLLAYYKLLDDLHDEGFLSKLSAVLVLPFLLRAAKKAMKRYEGLSAAVGDAIRRQSQLERDGCDSLDDAAQPMAKLLEEIFSVGFEGKEKAVLSRLGYCVGWYVYAADACDDLQKDIEKKRYNVLALSGGIKDKTQTEKIQQQRKKTGELLRITAAEAAKAYELLDKNGLSPLCENLLYDGLYQNSLTVSQRKNTRKEKADEKSL